MTYSNKVTTQFGPGSKNYLSKSWKNPGNKFWPFEVDYSNTTASTYWETNPAFGFAIM